MPPTTAPGPVYLEDWKVSHAKQLLIQDILSGEVTETMDAKDVYVMRDEYKFYKPANFKTNLKSLRAALKEQERRAVEDSAALIHDRAIRPRAATTAAGYPFWDGSEAQKFLKEDIDAGIHEGMKPAVFHLTRAEYKVFPIKTFREHIYQEVSSRKSRFYWMTKKKKY
jgi:hypothetical protein